MVNYSNGGRATMHLGQQISHGERQDLARVEALLRQCDALGAQLRQTRTLGAHLLDSTLHYLLAT